MCILNVLFWKKGLFAIAIHDFISVEQKRVCWFGSEVRTKSNHKALHTFICPVIWSSQIKLSLKFFTKDFPLKPFAQITGNFSIAFGSCSSFFLGCRLRHEEKHAPRNERETTITRVQQSFNTDFRVWIIIWILACQEKRKYHFFWKGVG